MLGITRPVARPVELVGRVSDLVSWDDQGRKYRDAFRGYRDRPRRRAGVECRVTDGGTKTALLSEVSLLSAVFILGTNPVAVKYAVGEVPPLPFVAFRFTLADLLLLLLLSILRLLGRWEPLGKRDLLLMAALGVVEVGLNNVLFTFGVGTTTASNTALIYATPPLWGMMLSFLLGTEVLVSPVDEDARAEH